MRSCWVVGVGKCYCLCRLCVYDFVATAILIVATRIQTMDKAKKLGWHGHVQTDEGIKAALESMVELKMLPAF